MKLVVTPSYDEMSRIAADLLIACIADNPHCVLGLATGSTPLGLYAELINAYQAGKISFAGVTTFNLDEYCGLPPTDPQSYRYFMQQHLFDEVDVDVTNTHVPCGTCDDEAAECAAYEQAIDDAGGIDLQLLGIGHNGHIGFNEPSASFSVVTHDVELTPSTREANSRLFNSFDEVPTHARTMGIGTIMHARKIVLIANGSGKAAILKEALFGPVMPEIPASVLQLHPDVTVIVDTEAAPWY